MRCRWVATGGVQAQTTRGVLQVHGSRTSAGGYRLGLPHGAGEGHGEARRAAGAGRRIDGAYCDFTAHILFSLIATPVLLGNMHSLWYR